MTATRGATPSPIQGAGSITPGVAVGLTFDTPGGSLLHFDPSGVSMDVATVPINGVTPGEVRRGDR